jgi:hypothetical protein
MAIDSGLAALGGALIGALGGIGTQYAMQGLLRRQSIEDRTRRETRTAAAFRGMLKHIGSTLLHYFNLARLPDDTMMEHVVKPLRDATAQPGLLLDLTPIQIDRTFSALGIAETIGAWSARIEDKQSLPPTAYEIQQELHTAIEALLEAAELFSPP